MTKTAYFGSNLAIFGPKILIFRGVSKSSGTHIMGKPPRQLVRIVFWSDIRHLAENASFGPNLAVFGPKIQFFENYREMSYLFVFQLFSSILGISPKSFLRYFLKNADDVQSTTSSRAQNGGTYCASAVG